MLPRTFFHGFGIHDPETPAMVLLIWVPEASRKVGKRTPRGTPTADLMKVLQTLAGSPMQP